MVGHDETRASGDRLLGQDQNTIQKESHFAHVASYYVEIAKMFLSVVILLSLIVCWLHALPSQLTSSLIV